MVRCQRAAGGNRRPGNGPQAAGRVDVGRRRLLDDDGNFISLSQLGLPVKVVVLNNGILSFVEMEMKASGFLDGGCELKNPNFTAMAEAMSIKGARAEAPDDLYALPWRMTAQP